MVNAIIHRDYAIEGAKCQLVVTGDTIRVMSPGQPVEPIKLEQIRSFNAPMLSRNPVLHYIFSRMELAEERGLGLTSLRQGAEDAGLPLPQYSWNAPYLTLTLYRSAVALAVEVAGHAVRTCSPSIEKIGPRKIMSTAQAKPVMHFIERLQQAGGLKGTDIANMAGVSKSTLSRWVSGRKSPHPDTQLKMSDLSYVVMRLSEFYTREEVRAWLYA